MNMQTKLKPAPVLLFRQITSIGSAEELTDLQSFFSSRSFIRMTPSFERLIQSPIRKNDSMLIARYHLGCSATDSAIRPLFPNGMETGLKFLAALIARDQEAKPIEKPNLGRHGLPNVFYMDRCAVNAVWQVAHWLLDTKPLDDHPWPRGTRLFVPPQ